MSFVSIKNKWLRRIILVVSLPFLGTIGVVAFGIYWGVVWMVEEWQDMPNAIGQAWRGRDTMPWGVFNDDLES